MTRNRAGGFTLVEIMIVVAIVALLAAVAIPNVLRGRTSANETASIGNIRALISSLEMYRSVNNAYPQSASWQGDMYPAGGLPAFGPPSFNVAMSGQTVQGYNYTYSGLPAGCTDAAGNCTQYSISTVPQTINQTGTRSFFANQTGLVTHEMGNSGASATCNTIDLPPSAAASC